VTSLWHIHEEACAWFLGELVNIPIITEEVEEDIVIQEDASKFDAEVEVEEIDEIYVSDEEPPADTSSVKIISFSLITIRTESDAMGLYKIKLN
jgi:hypothetical protein